MVYYNKHVFICTNQKDAGKKCCAMGGADSFFTHLKTQLKARHLHGPGNIRISKSGCLGRCAQGPCLLIYPAGIWYTYTTLSDIDEIIERALIKDECIERLMLKEPLDGEGVK